MNTVFADNESGCFDVAHNFTQLLNLAGRTDVMAKKQQIVSVENSPVEDA